jgi:flavin reductase (DIM6/NTAB) family NADH-FMN oxidoreductase RutF
VVPMRTTFDPDDLGYRFYGLLTSVVVPRPIAWVSTVSAAGVDNLAPHSFFTVACVNPPIVQFTSVGRKDSLCNAEATSEFVVNLTTEPLFEQVNATGTDFPADMSEFDAVGVEREPSLRVRPCRVAGSPVALECVLHSTLRLGDSTIVFGRVVLAAIRDDVLVDGYPEIDRLRPLSRLGREEWGAAAAVRSISRISYRDWPEHYEVPPTTEDPTT